MPHLNASIEERAKALMSEIEREAHAATEQVVMDILRTAKPDDFEGDLSAWQHKCNQHARAYLVSVLIQGPDDGWSAARGRNEAARAWHDGVRRFARDHEWQKWFRGEDA